MRIPAFILAATLCAEAVQASAYDWRGTFRVDIRLDSVRPASCAIHTLGGRQGAVALVTCLTSDIPSFGTPGWPVFTAGPVRAAADRSQGGVDRRVRHSATVAAPPAPDSHLEVEVSF